ncbi:hypothetical protein BBJ29_006814 [Phytophthora kernoviae]|uniref:Uncharacterized protein n=1 Tax=Phytophthora kernoviae TaxID=325452 RepID=A0A3R7GML6_9STRA|nr:hypothetical protein BBJ29_006814 [Phytophthora kernoviae]
MPATAGRVRMPHNNRMHSSAALKMTGIWKDTIGYDPYAAEGEKQEKSESSYEQAQGLMALAKLSNKSNDTRGACKKCGMPQSQSQCWATSSGKISVKEPQLGSWSQSVTRRSRVVQVVKTMAQSESKR